MSDMPTVEIFDKIPGFEKTPMCYHRDRLMVLLHIRNMCCVTGYRYPDDEEEMSKEEILDEILYEVQTELKRWGW